MPVSRAVVERGRRVNQEARAAANPAETLPAQKAKRSTASNRLRGFHAVTLTIPWASMVADNNKHAVMAVRTKGGAKIPRLILTPRYRAAKDAVEHMARRVMQGIAPTDGAVTLHAKLWFPDLRKRDAANYGKLLQDAMSGIVYLDDAQVEIATYEKAGIDREHPRCEVIINRRAA